MYVKWRERTVATNFEKFGEFGSAEKMWPFVTAMCLHSF